MSASLIQDRFPCVEMGAWICYYPDVRVQNQPRLIRQSSEPLSIGSHVVVNEVPTMSAWQRKLRAVITI